jgi:hypothetical protein
LVRTSEQFRQSDIRNWGLVALACGGLAVFGANVSAVLPSSLFVGLHTSRIEGASLVQLKQEIAQVRQESARLRRDNEIFNARFSLQEQAGSDATRRIGALEVSLPQLIEALPASSGIDRSTYTASIGTADGELIQAEGGSVLVRQVPLPQAASPVDATQPLPALIASAGTNAIMPAAHGVAIGPSFTPEAAKAQWQDLEIRLGSIVGEMIPVVGDGPSEGTRRLVIGPFAQASEARNMCQRLEQMNVSCTPADYVGALLAP